MAKSGEDVLPEIQPQDFMAIRARCKDGTGWRRHVVVDVDLISSIHIPTDDPSIGTGRK